MQLFSILFIAIFVRCAAQEEYCMGPRVADVRQRCAVSYGQDQAAITRIVSSAFAQTQSERCFRACTFAECNFLNFDGTIRQDVARRAAPLIVLRNPSRVNDAFQLLTYCQQTTPRQANICDYIEAYYTCVVKNARFPLTMI